MSRCNETRSAAGHFGEPGQRPQLRRAACVVEDDETAGVQGCIRKQERAKPAVSQLAWRAVDQCEIERAVRVEVVGERGNTANHAMLQADDAEVHVLAFRKVVELGYPATVMVNGDDRRVLKGRGKCACRGT
jgi:hypothetical protein